MEQTFFELKQTDAHIIKVKKYTSASQKKGNLLLLHGMAEHYERYHEFALEISANGYDVYLYSHRGHGTHLPIDALGYFGSSDGYKLVVKDAITVLTHIKNQSKNLPLFLMGHSMGSLIVRNVIQQYKDLDGIIICGTANPSPLITKFGLAVSALTGYKRNPKKKSPLMNRLMFGSPQYKKLRKRTPDDWLCTDTKVVDQYRKDDYCGFICTKSFYHDLLMLTKCATTPKLMKQTNTDTPIFIISGDHDPVGGSGKDVMKLVSFYKLNGYNASFQLYQGFRHEILNEPCKDEVTQDVLNFLNRIIK